MGVRDETSTRCVRGRVYILRKGSRWRRSTVYLGVLQELQPGLDGLIVWIKIDRPSIGVHRIRNLIVVRFKEWAGIEPDFGDVWVDMDGSAVGVHSVVILADAPIEGANAAPKRGVAAISRQRLLVRLKGLAVIRNGHVGSAKDVPAPCVVAI